MKETATARKKKRRNRNKALNALVWQAVRNEHTLMQAGQTKGKMFVHDAVSSKRFGEIRRAMIREIRNDRNGD